MRSTDKQQVEFTKFDQYWDIITEMHHLYGRIAGHFGMVQPQYEILYYIWNGTCKTQTDICEKTQLPKQTVNSIIKVMKNKGWIRLEQMESNRSKKEIFLTDEGREFYRDAYAMTIEVDRAAFSRMTEKQQDRFLAQTGKVLEEIRAATADLTEAAEE